MIWYLLHNIMNLFDSVIENKTRNFTTFLVGVVLYTLFYTYFGTYGPDYPFLSSFLKYAMYIILADGFVMAIIYKNFYKQTIFTEVNETLGANKPINETKNKKHVDKSSQNIKKEIIDKMDIFELKETPHYNSSEQNISSDAALGDYYTTNGKSNT